MSDLESVRKISDRDGGYMISTLGRNRVYILQNAKDIISKISDFCTKVAWEVRELDPIVYSKALVLFLCNV